MAEVRRYVTAFNGSRDYYQLPLALHENGLLERHVTDFYIPDLIAPAVTRHAPALSSRRNAGLPSARTALVPEALVRNAHMMMQPLSRRGSYRGINKALSDEAARISARTGAGLFLHSEYAYWAFKARPQARKLMFQYHPHPVFTHDILRADLDRHPEVRHSFQNETDSRDPSLLSPERHEEWQLADRILCNSTFTKASLVALGADPAHIDVAPLGAHLAPADDLPRDRDAEDGRRECRFLFVGQGIQRKGLHHLLKVWRNHRPPDSSLVVVARRLDPGIRPLLDQPGVIYHDGVAAGELRRLYATSDVFVLPSLVEGFGLVYLEAAAHGLFCIGTANTGLPDMEPPEGGTSLVIEAGDLDALASALAQAQRRWRDGEIDRAAIRRSLRFVSWEAHRRKIAEFARLSS